MHAYNFFNEGMFFFYWIMTHSRKWEEANLHSCLDLLPHKVASIECTNHCAFDKHNAQVPAVLDMRAISTRPLAWSSVHCGRWRDGRDIEMRGGGVRIKWKGNKRLLVAEPKRRLDFLLNMVLKPAASNKYSPSLWTACVPLAPVVYSDKENKA